MRCSSVYLSILGLLGLLLHQGLSAAINHVRLRHDNYHCFDEKPRVENGYYEVLRDDGHVIRAYCNEGFSLVGDTLRICDNATKRFSGDDPKCQDIDECLQIGDDTGSDEGSAASATYQDDEDDVTPVPCHRLAACINTPGGYRCQCKPGYHGDGYRCSEIPTLHMNINTNASLTVECPPPDPPEHGFIYQHSSDVIRFYCHPDFSLHGNTVIRCMDRTWSGHVPRCIPGWNTCGDPGIPEDGYRIGNRFSSGNIVRYKCRQAYRLVGPRFRICAVADADSTKLEWTSRMPNCTRPPPANDTEYEDEDGDIVKEDGVTEVTTIEETISATTTPTPTTTMTKTTTTALKTTTQPTTITTTITPNTTTTETQTTTNMTTTTVDTTGVPSTEEVPDIGIEVVEEIDDPVRSTLLQQKCGVPTKLEDQLSWPWLVEVRFRGAGSSSGTSDDMLCHGVLVCSDWVLTAASCLQTSEEHHARLLEPYDISVSLGDADWSVHNIARHPGYFMNAHGDNLALIMLTMSRDTKQEQMPVCLIRNTALGLRTNSVAWDYTSNSTRPVRFLLDDKCTNSTTVSEDSICTDTKSPVGAPLLVDSSPSSSLLSLFGLATSQDSAIYTTVIRQVKWIVQMTEACEL